MIGREKGAGSQRRISRRLMLFLGIFLVSVASHAHAIDTNLSIVTGIPGPLNPEKAGLLGFIQNGYLFALAIAGLLAVGSITYGAIQYTVSRGNPSKLSDAWDRITQALIGILLLVGAGTILTVVNPGLLSLELPQLAPVSGTPFSADGYKNVGNLNPAPRPGDTPEKPGPGGTGKCTAIPAAYPNNPCSIQKLSQTCFADFGADVPTKASMVCNAESAANVTNYNKGYTCAGGEPVVFGLFQINLKANPIITSDGTLNCPSAFKKEKGAGSAGCRLTDPDLYAKCKAAAWTSSANIATACNLYKHQKNANKWWDWEVAHPGFACAGKL